MSEFDVIVIGAGHNGLVLANYLQRCGLSVLLLERRLEAGGGLTTEEVTLPGFLHNLHSFFHDAVEVAPFYRDLDLRRHGLKYARPEFQVGVAVPSGDPLIIQADPRATGELIRSRSLRDARTYLDVHENYAEFVETVVIPALYSPPPRPSEASAALETSPEGLDFLHLSRRSPREVVDDLFQDELLRNAILFQLPIPRGVLDDYQGLGMMIPLLLSHAETSRVCLGGSHELAHALWRAFVASGGVLRGVHQVDRIVTEGGRAVAVETQGEKTPARRAVVSAVDIWQTFDTLLSDENLAGLRERVARFRPDEFSVFSVHLALREPPRYTAARRQPALDEAFKVAVGFEEGDVFDRLRSSIRRGVLPARPAFYAACPTRFDPSQAPPGYHTAFLWHPVPYELEGANWEEVKDDFARECLAAWQRAAPNLTKENILATRVFSPLDIERKFVNMRRGSIFMGRVSHGQIEAFRPDPLLSGYRTPVEGLYLCGAGTHPGGGILGACAYNCLQVMAKDLDLPRWWEEQPAR